MLGEASDAQPNGRQRVMNGISAGGNEVLSVEAKTTQRTRLRAILVHIEGKFRLSKVSYGKKPSENRLRRVFQPKSASNLLSYF